jgi:hypothetical protein
VVLEAEQRFHPSQTEVSDAARWSEDDPPWNHEFDFGSRCWRADEREFAPDASRALAHSLQPEVPGLPFVRHRGLNADPVVSHS